MKKFWVVFLLTIVGCSCASRDALYNQYRHVIVPVLARVAHTQMVLDGQHNGVPRFSWQAVNRYMMSHMFVLAAEVITGPVGETPTWRALHDVCGFLSHEVAYRDRALVVMQLAEQHANGFLVAENGRHMLHTLHQAWFNELRLSLPNHYGVGS